MAQVIFANFSLLLTLLLGLRVSAEECGWQAWDAVCLGGLCCSQYGWCGSAAQYCCEGCQSQCNCTLSPGISSEQIRVSAQQRRRQARGALCTGRDTNCGRVGDVGSIISRERFEEMLKHRNEDRCSGKGFYTYDAFIEAAKAFPAFATTGTNETRARELAAFFGQTSFESGIYDSDEPYTWGYCHVKEQNPGKYCLPSPTYPCAPGKQYYGRGPIQLKWNYNYGLCGEAIGEDLLNIPNLVETDPVISFKTAIWFWMTPQSPKPSCHEVITGSWPPSENDIVDGRKRGYGLITNIIDGWFECGRGYTGILTMQRIGYYKRYCDMFGVGYGGNLDCNNQTPYERNGHLDLVNSM